MNYYESVAIDYLRADRSIFVNTECCIQLNQAHNPDTSGPHWYCDAVAVDFKGKTIFLVEISYGKQLTELTKRLSTPPVSTKEIAFSLNASLAVSAAAKRYD